MDNSKFPCDPATVFCIDGSGNKDQKAANRKRPIYQLDVASGMISRPLLASDMSALQFFAEQINNETLPKPVLIAADLPIGLPEKPSDVFEVVAKSTFLEWLDATEARLAASGQTWREGMIAAGVSNRSALQPFVSISKGDDISRVQAKRACDRESRAESVYCVDHGAKQVGRAALQFWFEVLLPLRQQYKHRVAVWPFDSLAGADVIIAECYPAECQRIVYGANVKKRQSLEVAAAIIGLLEDKTLSSKIPTETWVYAASSEDEFDMFTTAVGLYKLLVDDTDIFWCPSKSICRNLEGWILGLRPSTSRGGMEPSKAARRGTLAKRSPAVPIGDWNRHDQQNLGPSGNRGVKGPLHRMKCRRRRPDGTECGHEYETNAQDVFQKKCPVCQ